MYSGGDTFKFPINSILVEDSILLIGLKPGIYFSIGVFSNQLAPELFIPMYLHSSSLIKKPQSKDPSWILIPL